MKHLVIIGAGGWGREVYESALHTAAYETGAYDIKGFLDDRANALNGLKGNYPPVIGSIETYEIQPDDVFFCAMGDSRWRKHYAEIIEAKGGKFITLIAQGAFVNPTATIGDGSFIAGWASVSDNVVLGRHVLIHPFSNLGHDVRVGDFSSLLSYTFMGGGAKVGKCCTINPMSMIVPRKSIGDNVVVGANSVVMRNFPENVHVFGNPARKLEF